jgi:hypothetical protein
MMSQQLCEAKAEMCEARAAECLDMNHSADWLEMASRWREMAGDAGGQATISGLMGINRARANARSEPIAAGSTA